MKHVKVLTIEKPAVAEETAWVSLKNILLPGAFLNTSQSNWVLAQLNNWLSK